MLDDLSARLWLYFVDAPHPTSLEASADLEYILQLWPPSRQTQAGTFWQQAKEARDFMERAAGRQDERRLAFAYITSHPRPRKLE